MMNGPDQLAIINQQINTIRRAMDLTHQQLEQANERVVQIRNELAEAYRQLARFRLDELAADTINSLLAETDRVMLQLLERRRQESEALEKDLSQAQARQHQLNDKRDRVVKTRDELMKSLDEKALEIKAELSRQPSYQAQMQRVTETAAQAEQALKKVDQAESDQEEKGKPYRSDPLFMYLWQRHFLKPDYKAGGLIRSLDGWVAKMINYNQAHSNYYLLTELPLRLRAHAERQQKIASEELEKLQNMEAQALETEAIKRDQASLDAVHQQLAEVEAGLETEEQQHQVLIRKRSAIANAEDETSRQMMELQTSELKNRTLTELFQQAQQTSKPDDDVIVSRIRDLMQERNRLDLEIKNTQQQENKHVESLGELEQLRRHFQQSDYDSQHSYFPVGFDLPNLLSLLLSGQTKSNDIWERISRVQEFRRPNLPQNFGGSLLSGSMGNRPSSRSDSRGGRIGGGHFKTGGKF
ncbi:hypothetical protein JXQ70_14075 [bacterium]|nr:hypothetical protein [bacterium]